MHYRRIVLSIWLLLFASGFVYGQSEALKVVSNNLGFYKKTKDLKFLAKAKKSIDSLIVTRKDSNNIEKLVYKGLVYITILQVDTANTLNQPADFFDKTANFYDEHLAVHKKARQYPEELKFIKQCLANEYIRQAFGYMNKSDFLNAEKNLTKARKYAPNFKPLEAYLAYSNNKLGNLQTAARYYNSLIKSDSIKTQYIQAAANINMAIGDTLVALEIIKKGKTLLPGDKYLLLDEANIYNNKKDYKALLPLLPALLSEYKNNANVAIVAANCYDQLGMHDKAEELYLQAVDINSAAFEPAFNLGVLYYKKSAVAKKEDSILRNIYYASKWFEKANEISPGNVKCLELLHDIYAQTGNSRQLDKVNNKLNQLNR